METTFIYVLIDPRTSQIRYVGKSNNPLQRLKNHCNPARYRPTHKFNWIRELKHNNLRPELEIIDIVSVEEWKFWEKYWICQLRCWGFDLVNHTEGGEGLAYGNQTSFKKGNKSWNEGTANKKQCVICGKFFKVFPSMAKKRKTCGHVCGAVLKKSYTKSTQFKKNYSPWNKGLTYTHNRNDK